MGRYFFRHDSVAYISDVAVDDDQGSVALSLMAGVCVGAVLLLPVACSGIANNTDEDTPPGGHVDTKIVEIKEMALPQLDETVLTVNGDIPFAISTEIGKKFILPNSSRTTELRNDVLVLAQHKGDSLDAYELVDGAIDPETNQPYVQAVVHSDRIALDTSILDGYAWIADNEKRGGNNKVKKPTITTREGAKTASFNGLAGLSTNNLAALCSTVLGLLDKNAEVCDKIAFVRRYNEDITAAAEARAREIVLEEAIGCMETIDSRYKRIIKSAIVKMVEYQRNLTKEQAERLVSVRFVDENGNGTNEPFNYHHTTLDNNPNLVKVSKLGNIETNTIDLEATCATDLPDETSDSPTAAPSTDDSPETMGTPNPTPPNPIVTQTPQPNPGTNSNSLPPQITVNYSNQPTAFGVYGVEQKAGYYE